MQPAEPREPEIVFACQECGEQITFPGDRRGHVGICPLCGEYVDVPDQSGGPPAGGDRLSAAAEMPPGAAGDSRATWQLWIEVLAVLCLAYFPYLWVACRTIGQPLPHNYYTATSTITRIIDALRVALPVLVIIALCREPWKRFGIVRPRWIADIVGGCVIWFCLTWAHRIVATLMAPAGHPPAGWRYLGHGAIGEPGLAWRWWCCAILSRRLPRSW